MRKQGTSLSLSFLKDRNVAHLSSLWSKPLWEVWPLDFATTTSSSVAPNLRDSSRLWIMLISELPHRAPLRSWLLSSFQFLWDVLPYIIFILLDWNKFFLSFHVKDVCFDTRCKPGPGFLLLTSPWHRCLILTTCGHSCASCIQEYFEDNSNSFWCTSTDIISKDSSHIGESKIINPVAPWW